MRKVSLVGIVLLISTAMFTSCTCQKQGPTPTVETVGERPSTGGFPAAMPKTTPKIQAKAPKPELPLELPKPAAEAELEEAPELPEDFPADVPIFEGAEVSRVFGMANNAHNVIFSTSAPVSDVSGFYRSKMEGQGWKVTQQFERGNHAFTTFQKGDMIANVTIAEDANNPGKQVISIMYEEQEPLDFEEF